MNAGTEGNLRQNAGVMRKLAADLEPSLRYFDEDTFAKGMRLVRELRECANRIEVTSDHLSEFITILEKIGKEDAAPEGKPPKEGK